MATSQTIILVEDDPSTRALIVTWLDTEGYDVRTASNGREALVALLQEEPPCLMVVDLNMPVIAIPFILVSGADNAVRIARELDIDEVIAKPCAPDQLLRIVATYCDASDGATHRSNS